MAWHPIQAIPLIAGLPHRHQFPKELGNLAPRRRRRFHSQLLVYSDGRVNGAYDEGDDYDGVVGSGDGERGVEAEAESMPPLSSSPSSSRSMRSTSMPPPASSSTPASSLGASGGEPGGSSPWWRNRRVRGAAWDWAAVVLGTVVVMVTGWGI
jgi:hypothetical protein